MRSGRQNVQLARATDGQTEAISHKRGAQTDAMRHNIRNGLGKVISGASIRERQPGSRHLGAVIEECGARRLLGATRRATPTKTLLRRAVIGIEHLAAIRHNVYLGHQLLLGVPLVPPLLLKWLIDTCTALTQLFLWLPLVPPLRLLSQTAIATASVTVQTPTHHRQFNNLVK